jgi:ELWxxDGT repeat protein
MGPARWEALEPRRHLSSAVQVIDLLPGRSADPRNFVASNGLLYFVATASSGKSSLYRSDGTAAGTFAIRDTAPIGFPAGAVASDSALYFHDGTDLWASDGTVAGTRSVIGDAGDFSNVFFVNNQLIGPRNGELSTIRKGRFRKVIDADTGFNDNAFGLAVVGNTLYFAAADRYSGSELYRTDGTREGTRFVKDINPGPEGSQLDPLSVSAVGSRIFFLADDGTHAKGLYISDGAAAGTRMVKDLTADTTSLYRPVVAGGLLYFFTRADGEASYRLWRSDGKPSGTYPIATLPPISGSFLEQTAFADPRGVLYFMYDGQLWRSEGTAQTTLRVKEFNPPAGAPALVVSAGRLFITPAGGLDDYPALWESDGLSENTLPVSDPSGQFISSPQWLTAVGDRIFFSEQDVNNDRELWVVEPSTPPVGTITGIVFVDFDHDGVFDRHGIYSPFDPGEPPLPGYRVFIDRNNDGICNKNEIQTRASTTGRYTFTGLPIGTYRIRLTTVETRVPTTPTVYTVKLTANARVVRSFGNVGGTITGTIYLDRNANGLLDADETAETSVNIFLDLNGNGVADPDDPVVRSWSNGRYTMVDLPVGTFNLIVSTVGRAVLDVPPLPVTLPLGGSLRRNFGFILAG